MYRDAVLCLVPDGLNNDETQGCVFTHAYKAVLTATQPENLPLAVFALDKFQHVAHVLGGLVGLDFPECFY